MIEGVNWVAWLALGMGFLAHTIAISWFLAKLSTNVGQLAHDVKNLKMITESISLMNERITNLRKDHEELKGDLRAHQVDVWREINGIKERATV